jgi:hypothetical protein
VTRGTDIPGIETKFGAIARAHPSRDIQTSFAGWQQMEAAMTYVPTQRERLILENPEDPRIIRTEAPWKVTKGTPWNRIVAVLKNPDLAAIVMLCVIGLLVTAALLLAVPDFGEISQSLQQF